MDVEAILWRRVDVPGHDACRVWRDKDGWCLSGMAIAQEADGLCSLAYHVRHDADWQTKSAHLTGWAGTRNLDLTIQRLSDREWRVNGASVPAVAGCVDVDLGFTPATNTTALRRLALGVGQSAEVSAAWLDTKDWQLKPLAKTYRRVSEQRFDYGSAAHGFQTALTVNATGFVTDYPELWAAEL